MTLETGLSYTAVTHVASENCAAAVGSGDLEVFATPAMAALMEKAAMLAVAESLPEGSTTVGCALDITHSKPTPVGLQVAATATLTHIDGRTLSFDVEARDSNGIIGSGRHVRVIVDRKRFTAKAYGN